MKRQREIYLAGVGNVADTADTKKKSGKGGVPTVALVGVGAGVGGGILGWLSCRLFGKRGKR